MAGGLDQNGLIRGLPASQQYITPPPYTAMAHQALNPFGINAPHQQQDDSDDEDGLLGEQEPLSCISLDINTHLSITGDNNMMAIDPAAAANKISEGIVVAMKQMSQTAGGGIPMLDEEGRPRPLKITVQASTTINGQKNYIGSAAVMARIDQMKEEAMTTRRMMREAMVEKQKQSEMQKQADVPNGKIVKRERADSKSADTEGDSKRTRRE